MRERASERDKENTRARETESESESARATEIETDRASARARDKRWESGIENVCVCMCRYIAFFKEYENLLPFDVPSHTYTHTHTHFVSPTLERCLSLEYLLSLIRNPSAFLSFIPSPCLLRVHPHARARVSLSISRALSLCRLLARALFLARPRALFVSLSYSLSLSLALVCAFAPSLVLSLALAHLRSLARALSVSRSLSPALSPAQGKDVRACVWDMCHVCVCVCVCALWNMCIMCNVCGILKYFSSKKGNTLTLSRTARRSALGAPQIKLCQ